MLSLLIAQAVLSIASLVYVMLLLALTIDAFTEQNTIEAFKGFLTATVLILLGLLSFIIIIQGTP
jgi:hypothetical protein